MDIKIEAPGHPRQDSLQLYYSELLDRKYGHYDFVKSVDVKVTKVNDLLWEVSLQLKPEKGKMLFAKDSQKSEDKALNEVIGKMNHQIEKYKLKHYHSAQRRRKNQ
jgi:ribosome-associated translation inhibitor RaiA